MNSKLTLSVDSDLLRSAKNFSKKKKLSLSKMFELYLEKTIKTDSNLKGSSVKDLKGILGKVSKDWDYKKELLKILEEKHK